VVRRVVNLRSRRLETVLGAPLDELTALHIKAMVSNGVTEAFDLDLKKETYGGSDQDKRELAKDVAALANTAGGVIIIGVDEDDQGRASATPGTTISDREKTRLQQIIAAGVVPMPVFDIISVDDENLAEGLGYLLIAVPRSPTAPHAVTKNPDLRYPKRNGTVTRYLSEPEVATAYRERQLGAGLQDDRLVEIERDAIALLDLGRHPWVLISLVPDLPGEIVVSAPNLAAFRTSVLEQPVAVVDIGMHFFRVSVGQRCFLADNTSTYSPQAHSALLALHADGSGIYALGLHDITRHPSASFGAEDEAPAAHLISDEWLALAVLSGLHRLGTNARDRAATGGTALLKAQLVAGTTGGPVKIGSYRNHGFTDALPNSRAVNLPIRPARLSVALDDLADAGPALVSAAAILSHEIGQAFGVTELSQLTRDGRVQPQYWSHDAHFQQLRSWAEVHGIMVGSTAVPD